MDEGKSSPIESELGERVGSLINERYRVLRVIGHGSTGAVYACQHVGLDKLVALKVLHREMEQNASFVDRFKLEAQAASRLEHPNSVRVLDFGQDLATGALFIAMEYIEGRDLLQVLEEDGPFSAERAIDVMSQILDVLGVAHGLGIVHRDLKPENILLRTVQVDGVTREHVTVCDFGIAQFGGRRALDGSTTNASPDGEEGLVAGTPAYMSPEQARAEPQDARSDVYSAGVVLYQLLTLQLPFYADDAYALALKHCVEVPPPPSRFGAVSPQLEEICLKALSKSRDARYQSARDMRIALQRVLIVTPEGSSSALDGSGKARRWGRPRPISPQVTPADAPAVEAAAVTQSAATAMGRGWRWSLGLAAALCTVVFAFALLSHNQDQRAIAAGPSNTSGAHAGNMLRPQRVATPTSRGALAPAPAPALVNDAPRQQAGARETAYSAMSTAPSAKPTGAGGELPDAQATLPGGPLASVASLGAGAESSTSLPLVEGEEIVADSGESARRGNGTAGSGGNKSGRGQADSGRSERRGHVTITNNAQDKQDRQDKSKDAQRADKAAAASNAAVSDKAASASAQPAAAARAETRADARPESHLDSLELGLLPDIPIDSEVASATAEAAPAPMAAAPKAVLVSRVAHEDDEPEARDPARRGNTDGPSEAMSAAPLANSAHVSITKIASRSGVSKSSVRGALNLTAITDCYRSAIRGGGVSGNRVVGELELATSQSGSVTEASLNAPELPTPLRHCVEQIVRRGRVKEADTGNAQATITLAFLPR